jgi:hypothetical protein
MKLRQIVLRDAGGTVFKCLDVSDVDHANVHAVMTLEVRTQCDTGDWHVSQRTPLDPWGTRLTEESVYSRPCAS